VGNTGREQSDRTCVASDRTCVHADTDRAAHHTRWEPLKHIRRGVGQGDCARRQPDDRQLCLVGTFLESTAIMPTLTSRLVSGAIGAGVLTAIHQAAQRVRDDAPRMDVVGMEVIERTLARAGATVPGREQLFYPTLAGDLIANGIYYSVVPAASARQTWTRALALGLIAGAGALLLPRYVASGDPPHSHGVANQVMTVAWYTAGAIATAACAEWFRRSDR